MMSANELPEGEPGSLARLLQLGIDDVPWWTDDELADVLRHQMAAPLDFAQGDDAPSTFGQLLHAAEPPVELLERTKQYARRCRESSELPEHVATMLYLLSIVVARLRCGRRITSLDDGSLRERLEWALQQPWVDAHTRSLLAAGLKTLGEGRT